VEIQKGKALKSPVESGCVFGARRLKRLLVKLFTFQGALKVSLKKKNFSLIFLKTFKKLFLLANASHASPYLEIKID